MNKKQIYALKTKAASLHIRILSGNDSLRGTLGVLLAKIAQLESSR
jgi:hypothetical protein